MQTESDSSELGRHAKILEDHADALRQTADHMASPRLHGLTFGQALTGIVGALATQRDPHAHFVSQYLPQVAAANRRADGNEAAAWQSTHRDLLHRADTFQELANRLRSRPAPTSARSAASAGSGPPGSTSPAALPAEGFKPAGPDLPLRHYKAIRDRFQHGISGREDGLLTRLNKHAHSKGARQAVWSALQDLPGGFYRDKDPEFVAETVRNLPSRKILPDMPSAEKLGKYRQNFGFTPRDSVEAQLAGQAMAVWPRRDAVGRKRLGEALIADVLRHRRSTSKS